MDDPSKPPILDHPVDEASAFTAKARPEESLPICPFPDSLFAFGKARKANVAVVARVSNAVDREGSQFDTGSNARGLEILKALARAGRSFLAA